MNFDRPEVRPPLRKPTKIPRFLPALALLAASCTYDGSPVMAQKEVDGCIRNAYDTRGIPNQHDRLEFEFRPDFSVSKRLVAVGDEIDDLKDISKGDRVRLTFTIRDFSFIPGGRQEKRKQLYEELQFMFQRSRTIIVGTTSRIITSISLLQKNSPNCRD